MGKIKNIKGQRFSRLVAREYIGLRDRRAVWLCDCDCGNKFISAGKELRAGKTRSCGCYQKHITTKRNYRHGMCHDRVCKIYYGIIKRCYNHEALSYKHYGGRGIKICEEWLHNPRSFIDWSLENGYSDDLTIDRIDNNSDYTPQNCRWATGIEQANNKRNNHMLEIDGSEKTLSDWSRLKGISYGALKNRVKNNWSPEDLFKPPRKQRRDTLF